MKFFSRVMLAGGLALGLASNAYAATTWTITVDWGDWNNASATFDPTTGAPTLINEGNPPADGGQLTGWFTFDSTAAAAYYSYYSDPSNLTNPDITPPSSIPIVDYSFTSTATSADATLGITNPLGNSNPFPVIHYDSDPSLINNGGYGTYFGNGDIAFLDNSGMYTLDIYLPDLTGLFGNVADTGNWQVYEFYDQFYTNPIDPTQVNPNTGLNSFETFTVRGDSTTSCDGNCTTTYSAVVANTPEPISLALLGTGLIGLGAFGRRFNRRK